MNKFRYKGNSFRGNSHTENQDDFLIIDEKEFIVAAIFDGVTMAANPRNGVNAAMQFIRDNFSGYIGNGTMKLDEMMAAANKSILKTGIPGFFTTYAIAGFFKDNSGGLYYSNLGDSRIYLYDGEALFQCTTDDILYPGSNFLTKCLGSNDLSDEDFRMEKYKGKLHTIVLATDGCYNLWKSEPEYLLRMITGNNFNAITSGFDNLIKGNNFDDATYIVLAPVT